METFIQNLFMFLGHFGLLIIILGVSISVVIWFYHLYKLILWTSRKLWISRQLRNFRR